MERDRVVPPRIVLGALVLAAGALWPTTAEAHLVTTGLGPIYDGISHVLASPDDLVPVLAMAALAGMNGASAGRWAVFTLSISWLTGGVAGYLGGAMPPPLDMTAASFLVIGALTAADLRLSSTVTAAFALVVGLLHGWLNGAAIAETQGEALGLVGIAVTVFVLVALGAGFVVSRRTAWARLAVRIAGSWVAAIGLLMLGWSLRGVA